MSVAIDRASELAKLVRQQDRDRQATRLYPGPVARECDIVGSNGHSFSRRLVSKLTRTPLARACSIAASAASHAAIVSSTTSNCTIYVVVVEELGRPAALRSSQPHGNGLDNPVASNNWRAEATIEEHGIGSSHALVYQRTVHGVSGLGQKCSKVLGDGRIAGVR